MASCNGYKNIITCNLDYLCENIDIKNSKLLILLQQNNVISAKDGKLLKDQIGNTVEYKIVHELLGIIIDADSDEKFNLFIKSLEESDNKSAAQKLEHERTELSKARKENKERISRLLAKHYCRAKSDLCLYAASEDPDLCPLRAIYTRTDLVDVKGWPPKNEGNLYDDYSQLFKHGDGSFVERVLVYGHPGMGKSVLAQKITLDWADSINGRNSLGYTYENEATLVKNIDFLVYLDLSEITRDIDFVTAIQEQLKMTREDSIQLHNYMIEYPNDCMCILDGWDEFMFNNNQSNDITKIASGNGACSLKLLVTTRVMEKKSLPDYFDKNVSIQGFNTTQAKEFVSKYEKHFGCGKHLEDSLKTKKLWMHHNVPFLLCRLCILCQNPDISLKTITDIFIALLQDMIDKHELRKRHKKFSADAHIDVSTKGEEYTLSSKLAFCTLFGERKGQTTFTSDMIGQILDIEEFETIKDFGLIHKREKIFPGHSDVYSFGHKNIHEFLAGVYIAHHQDALDTFVATLTSLMKIYENRLLIQSICGLSPSAGISLCNHMLTVSYSDKVTDARKCPDFSHITWVVNGDSKPLHLFKNKAKDVGPFILECCTEMVSDPELRFPKARSKDTHSDYISLPMELNFSSTPIDIVTDKIKSNILKLNRENKVFLVNSEFKNCYLQAWDYLFDHLAQSSDKIEVVRLYEIKADVKETCRIQLGSFLKRLHQLKVLTLGKVNLQKETLTNLLVAILNCKNLVAFELFHASVLGTQNKLIEALSVLKNIQALALSDLEIAKKELSAVFDTIAAMDKLKWLQLKFTKLNRADKALAKCIKTLTKLEFLSLRETNITVEQSKDVWSAMKSCAKLRHINMSGCNVAEAAEEMCATLKYLKELEILLLIAEPEIQNLNVLPLSGENMVQIFQHLPHSVSLVNATLATDTRNVLDIAKSVPKATALKHVKIYLPPDLDHQQFKTEIQETRVNWIGSAEDWEKEKDEYFKIRKSRADKFLYIDVKDGNVE